MGRGRESAGRESIRNHDGRARARAFSPEYFCICMQFSSCSARTEERNGFTIRLNAYAPRYSGWFRKTIRRLPREWPSKNRRLWCLRAARNDDIGRKKGRKKKEDREKKRDINSMRQSSSIIHRRATRDARRDSINR